MNQTLRRSLLPTALAALVAVPVLMADMSQAHADVRIRVGGNVKVKVGGHVRVRRHHRHHRHRTHRSHVRLRIGGHIRLGGGVYYGARFAPPPPPRCSYECGHDHRPVPAYYAPVGAPPPTPYIAAAPEPRQPVFGIGIFAGSVSAEDGPSGDDLGLFARLRLSRSLHLEGEIAKTEISDGARVDRRVGGALLWDLAPHSRWSPFLLGGMGVAQVEMDEGVYQAEQGYAEVGVGLGYRLSDRFQIAADLRAGARSRTEEAAPSGTALRTIAPPEDEEEGYTRGRLSAILYF